MNPNPRPSDVSPDVRPPTVAVRAAALPTLPQRQAAARPFRALDLFCGAGGASMGLHRAGFDVVGVDINPQPRYPFKFIQADALAYAADPLLGDEFDFIWASPPCQDYSTLKVFAGEKRGKMVSAVRDLLRASGVPFVIENVQGSDLEAPIVLCGTMFGLGVWRHRLFEMHPPLLLVPQCRHELCPEPIDVTGTGSASISPRKKQTGGQSRKPRGLAHASEVMGIDWMSRKEISQAIPPAYSEFIARAFLAQAPRPYLQPKVE